MKFHHFESIGSTNDHLIRMAENGAGEWTVVTADIQTAGRGRSSRAWWSPQGNLYMSVLLRPAVNPRQLLRLPAIASLAFLSALGDRGSSLKIKWPNDVLLDGKKMAGILAESRTEGEKVLWAVVGFGVNMARGRNDVPPELMDRVAFVDDLHLSLRPRDLALRIVRHLQQWSGAMKGGSWDRAMEEWTRHALLDVPYVHRNGDMEIRGTAVRLDRSGGLVMETPSGEVTVYSGELISV